MLEREIEDKAKSVSTYKAAAMQGRSWLAKLVGSQPRLPREIQELEFQRSYVEDELKEEQERLRFLERRNSPPRCLLCGAINSIVLPTAVEPAGTDDDPGPPTPIGFRHPRCSGELLVAHSGVMISIRPIERQYDREANLISSGKPRIDPKRAPPAVRAKARQLTRERWDREAAQRQKENHEADHHAASEGTSSGAHSDKNSLIKDLIRLRIRTDPEAGARGFTEAMVDSLSGFQLAGVPEATIVTIVETWALLHKQGAPDHEIFSRIEDHRSRLFPRGQMPTPLTLSTYVDYRLKLEHSRGAPLAGQFIESAINKARQAYAA